MALVGKELDSHVTRFRSFRRCPALCGTTGARNRQLCILRQEKGWKGESEGCTTVRAGPASTSTQPASPCLQNHRVESEKKWVQSLNHYRYPSLPRTRSLFHLLSPSLSTCSSSSMSSSSEAS